MDDPNADIDAAAVRLARSAHHLTDEFGGKDVSQPELEVAFDEFLRGMAGRTPASEIVPEALGPLGAAVGLDRARAEAPAGATPWLTELPGVALADAVTHVSESALTARLESVSDEGLEEAREVARDLTQSLGVTARLFDIALPRGAFGFGMLGPLASNDPLGKAAAFLNAIVLPAESRTAAGGFAEATAEFEALIELGRRWLDEHPEHAADAKRRGLMAVVREVNKA